MVKQCSVIFGCLAAGEFLSWILQIPVPGSILDASAHTSSSGESDQCRFGEGNKSVSGFQYGFFLRAFRRGNNGVFRCHSC